MWNKIVKSYLKHPRDVQTQPITNRTARWFYVYVEDGKLYVDSARGKEPSSHITQKRLLAEKDEICNIMYDIYLRRKKGEHVSAEATAITVNQVYWYGIFADMGY